MHLSICLFIGVVPTLKTNVILMQLPYMYLIIFYVEQIIINRLPIKSQAEGPKLGVSYMFSLRLTTIS